MHKFSSALIGLSARGEGSAYICAGPAIKPAIDALTASTHFVNDWIEGLTPIVLGIIHHDVDKDREQPAQH